MNPLLLTVRNAAVLVQIQPVLLAKIPATKMETAQSLGVVDTARMGGN